MEVNYIKRIKEIPLFNIYNYCIIILILYVLVIKSNDLKAVFKSGNTDPVFKHFKHEKHTRPTNAQTELSII